MFVLDCAILYLLHFNREVLVPLRLLLTALHGIAHATIMISYTDNVLTAFPLRGPDNPNFAPLVDTTQIVVWFGVISILVSLGGIMLGFSVGNAALNTTSCVAHVVASYALFIIWEQKLHYVRIWHVFYFLQLAPAIVEIVNALWLLRQKKRRVF
eukprot:PhF_6_TR496/c0_g1_i2/m.251